MNFIRNVAFILAAGFALSACSKDEVSFQTLETARMGDTLIYRDGARGERP